MDYTEKVGEEATQQFLKIGLLRKSEVKNEDPENRAYRKYLYHGISHHLGVDVHDLGTRTEPIKAGMVFTVEPGIYIPAGSKGVAKRWWNIGVRIEDDVAVTKAGHEVLTAGLPREPHDIERFMA